MELNDTSNDQMFTHLNDLIADGNLDKLRACFGAASGRGRPPKLPPLKVTNKLLLQLYICKGSRSWNDLTSFAQKFIALDTERIRYIIEKTVARSKNCDDKENLERFLEQELSPFIGIQLSAAGLTSESIMNLEPQNPPLTITNGMIIELEKFRNKRQLSAHWITDAIFAISAQLVEEPVLVKEVKKLWSEYKINSKSQSRHPQKFQEFLNEKTVFLTTNSEANQSTHAGNPTAKPATNIKIPLTPTKTQNYIETLTPENPKKRLRPENDSPTLTPHSQGIQIKKLRSTIDGLEKQLACEKDCVQTLQQLVEDAKIKKSKLESANFKLESSVSKLETELERVRQVLNDKHETLSKVRHSAFYKRLKRKESRIRHKELDKEKLLDTHFQQKLHVLKSKLKSTQTRLSNEKSRLTAANKDRTHQKEVINLLKESFVRVQEEERAWPTVSTRESGSQKFTTDVVKCVIQLIGETEMSGRNCGIAIQIVCRNLFNIHLDAKDLPSERSSLRFADQGHILAKHQIAEALLDTKYSDLHSDGTSKDHRKYVGHQLTTDSGQTLSCGFTPVCQENTETLVDIAFGLLHELAEVYNENEIDQVFKGLLQNLSALMSDRASVMKSFNKAFSDKRKDLLSSDEGMEFLHCNAHFLLGLSSASDKVLKKWESEQICGLGRDASGKFSSFSSSSETSTSRVIRTACDILGPRGDEKNGCRDSWEAFCSLQNFPSHIASFKGNRFNNYFQAAAALHFHRHQIQDFLQNFMPSLNRKQDSVLLDLKCETLDCALTALGVLYEKVTGPYWLLMGTEMHYLDFFKHVCSMQEALTAWSVDGSMVFKTDTPPLFGLNLQTAIFPVLYEVSEEKKLKIIVILQDLCTSFKSVVQRQLADFLPDGRYHDVQSTEVRSRLSHSKITNLVGEECFGDLDFSIFKRRHASIHHHSTVNMLKRNKTSAWFSSKSRIEQEHLLAIAAKKSSSMREAHQHMQRAVVARRKEMLKIHKEEKEAKAQKVLEKKKALIEAVKEHGGPCLTAKSLTNVLKSTTTQKEKTEVVKNEIRYQKTILGVTSPLLKLACKYETLIENLKTYFDSDGVHQSADIRDVNSPYDSDIPDEVSDTHDDFDEDASHFGHFEFTKQGQNVAVYFDDEFYIGQVVMCKDMHVGNIKFMDKCGIKKNVYRWPRTDCVEEVESMFVFSWDFELSTTNGRMWYLKDDVAVYNQYEMYKELYC